MATGPLDELVAPRARPMSRPALSSTTGVHRATVKAGPDGGGLIVVTLDATPNLTEPPCRFSPVGDMDPAPGDIALVSYDQENRHYVTAWWPA